MGRFRDKNENDSHDFTKLMDPGNSKGCSNLALPRVVFNMACVSLFVTHSYNVYKGLQFAIIFAKILILGLII